jgi:hypothetical protein
MNNDHSIRKSQSVLQTKIFRALNKIRVGDLTQAYIHINTLHISIIRSRRHEYEIGLKEEWERK